MRTRRPLKKWGDETGICVVRDYRSVGPHWRNGHPRNRPNSVDETILSRGACASLEGPKASALSASPRWPARPICAPRPSVHTARVSRRRDA